MSLIMRTLLPLLTILTLGACSSQETAILDAGDSSDFDDTGLTDFDTDIDAVATGDADLFSFEGELAVTDGLIDPTNSTLSMTFYAQSTALCQAEVTLDTATIAAVDDAEVSASSWWTLGLSPTDPATECALLIPATLGLGAAAYDAQLQPAADAFGLEADDATALFTALAQVSPGGPVYIFGVLGTTAQFDGDDTLDTSAAVESGVYTLSTLYLLPLP